MRIDPTDVTGLCSLQWFSFFVSTLEALNFQPVGLANPSAGGWWGCRRPAGGWWGCRRPDRRREECARESSWRERSRERRRAGSRRDCVGLRAVRLAGWRRGRRGGLAAVREGAHAGLDRVPWPARGFRGARGGECVSYADTLCTPPHGRAGDLSSSMRPSL